MAKIRGKQSSTNIVGFRLESELLVALTTASERANLSVHEYSKRLIIEQMNEEKELSQLQTKVDRIEAMLRTVGLDLLVGVQELLFSIHKKQEPVEKWVAENMHCFNWQKKKEGE